MLTDEELQLFVEFVEIISKEKSPPKAKLHPLSFILL